MLTVFRQTSNFPHQEALLYVFEDNDAVIKMITKRSPTMRNVSRTHRVALDWSFDRINLDSKIQIKYIDTKNQLADLLIKGNFTRDEWNHLLCLFNISHFSSTVCSEAMAKRLQQDSGEERVTAKSRPMMSVIAMAPSTLSSSASESTEKKVMKVRVLGVRILRNMIERGHPLFALGQGHTSSKHVSLVNTSTSSLKKKKITIERGHPLFALNEEQGHSNSSLEMTKQNWNCR